MNSRFIFANPVLGAVAIGCVLLAFGILHVLKKKKRLPLASLLYSRARLSREALEEETSPAAQEPMEVQILRLIRLLALVFLAIALARPQKVSVEELEPVAGVDIMLTVDTSASMQALDFEPLNRLQAAKEIMANFIAKRKGDRLGLVTFGGSALLTCPLTLDTQAIASFLNQVEIGMTQTEGTAIGSGLMTAIAHLRKVPSKSKILILLTDGRNNAGAVDPMTAAKLAQSLGIKIYSVGCGKRGGGIFAVQDPLFGVRYVRAPEEEIDEEALTKISLATGGKYFRATEMNELRSIFSEIDRMEKTVVDAPRQVRYEDLYVPMAVAALAVLGSETLLRATWLFTLP